MWQVGDANILLIVDSPALLFKSKCQRGRVEDTASPPLQLPQSSESRSSIWFAFWGIPLLYTRIGNMNYWPNGRRIASIWRETLCHFRLPCPLQSEMREEVKEAQEGKKVIKCSEISRWIIKCWQSLELRSSRQPTNDQDGTIDLVD